MKNHFAIKLVFCAMPLLFLSTNSLGSSEESFTRGKELAAYCSGCHGETGISAVSTNPNLAGQKKDYLVYALKAYRSQERKGGMAFVMHSNAARLTDQNIEDLATYFSAQK